MDSGTHRELAGLAPALMQFLDELQEAGYGISLIHYLAVQDLLLVLTRRGDVQNLQELKPLLGPILCSSPTEQLDFPQRFDRWAEQVRQRQYRPSLTEEEQAKVLEAELSSLQRRAQWLRRWLVVIATLSTSIFALVLFHTYIPKQEGPAAEELAGPAAGDSANGNALPPLPEDPQTAPSPTEEPESSVPEDLLVAPPPPEGILGPGPQLGEFLYVGIVAALLLSWRCWWWWRARLFLSRRETNKSPELQNISLQGIKSTVFPPRMVFQAAQQLRQRTRQPANTLDIDQTIQASLKRGGWFTPVYGYRQVIPEYLVLIDRASYGDHQAKLVETLVQQLRQDGVYATRYFFDGDARVCYPDAQAGLPQTLDVLAKQHREKRLVVVASAETFYSSQTGEAVPWLEELQGWGQRAILIPNPAESWGRWEFGLASQFAVLPLSPHGIVALALVFGQGAASYRLNGDAAPFPETLAMRPQRWLERHTPSPEEGRRMLGELGDYLGETGLYWFAACAVFPELHWSITVYLGNVLQDEAGRPLLESYPLVKLARLPWFRQGYIPDWLRQYLVVNLTAVQNKTIHQAFLQLMVTAVQGAVGPLQLQIAQQYQQSLSSLTKPLLRRLSRRAADEAPLKDYIFVDFMAREALLRVAVPEDVQPLLRGSRYERAVRQQRRMLAGVVSSLVAVAGLNAWWVMTTPTREMNQLLQSAQSSVEENTLLEALVSLTRMGQMLRASSSKNANLTSSTIGLFLQLVPQDVDASEISFEFREQNQLEGHRDEVNSVAFSPDGQTIASASSDNTIRLWNQSGELLAVLEGHSDVVNSVAFRPNGQTLASASLDSTVRLWNQSGEELAILEGHSDSVLGVAFSPDGQTLASASRDSTIRLWNQSGELLAVLEGHSSTVWGVAFSPDGQTLASASLDSTVRLWNQSGELLAVLEDHRDVVLGVAFSPDGQTLASASSDNTIRLWNQSGELLAVLEDHRDEVNSVAFSPDGQTLASASRDNTIRLWNQSGELLAVLEDHRDVVWSVAFNPDGQTLASASSDNTIRLRPWSLDTFIALSCNWLDDYLRTNPNATDEDRALCGISKGQSTGERD